MAFGKKAIDVAFTYGFSTYAGFYKAFVKEYGSSPKKYLTIYKDELKGTGRKEHVFMNMNKQE